MAEKPGWNTKTTTARRVAEIISSYLDDEDEMGLRDLRLVTKRMAQAFDFTDEEREAFVDAALASYEDDEHDD